MERTFFLLEQQLLRPIYAIYPWSPDLKTSLPPVDQEQFEKALFARTAQINGSLPSDPAGRANAARSAMTTASSPFSLQGSSFVAKAQAVESKRSDGYEWLKMAWVVFGVACFMLIYVRLWFVVRWTWMLAIHVIFVFLLFPLLVIQFLGPSVNAVFSSRVG